MFQFRKIAIGAATLALVLGGAAALAQQGRMEGMQGMHGNMGGMHGQMAGRHSGDAGHEAFAQLMTPQEREAMREKMKSAKTSEERQALQAAMRTEMEKRAKDKGITLPERHARMGGMGGMRMGMGRHGQGPESGEHRH